MATPNATADPANRVLTFPSPPKVVSRCPLCLYRTRVNPPPEEPATTILPSGCRATALARPPDLKFVATLPSPPKVGSRLPAPADAGGTAIARTIAAAPRTETTLPRMDLTPYLPSNRRLMVGGTLGRCQGRRV